MRNYVLWRTSEDKYIIDNYSKLSTEEIARGLGRTILSVKHHIKEMKDKGNLPHGRKPKIAKRS